MLERKNVTKLTPQEKQNFIAGVQEMKTAGDYDNFVKLHAIATSSVSAINGGTLNGAHRGPAFLLWHRAFLYEFETTLQKYLSSPMGLPYWDWTTDPTGLTVFTSDFMGGNGDSKNGFRVSTGPFANPNDDPKKWLTSNFDPQSGTMRIDDPLLRAFNTSYIPTKSTIISVMITNDFYDDSPFNALGQSGFRSLMEKKLHDMVHVYVGGHMGNPMVAPNDPVFYLHHVNIDRLFLRWQEYQPTLTYPQKNSGGPDPFPLGQNWNDKLLELNEKVSDCWNINTLGYMYKRSINLFPNTDLTNPPYPSKTGPYQSSSEKTFYAQLPQSPSESTNVISGLTSWRLYYTGLDDFHLKTIEVSLGNTNFPNNIPFTVDLADKSNPLFGAYVKMDLLFFKLLNS